MSATKIKIWVDKENQIIRQIIEGNVDEQDALYITFEMEKKIKELKNQDKIDVLIAAEKLGVPDAGARRILIGNLKRQNVNKLVVISRSPVQRAIVSLIRIVIPSNKLKIVPTETEALSWLLSR